MKIAKQNQVNHGSFFQMNHFYTVKSMDYNGVRKIGYDLVLPIPVGFTTEVPDSRLHKRLPSLVGVGWGGDKHTHQNCFKKTCDVFPCLVRGFFLIAVSWKRHDCLSTCLRQNSEVKEDLMLIPSWTPSSGTQARWGV